MEKYLPKVIGFLFNALALISPRRAAQKALHLFCSPRKGRLRPHESQYLAQFSQRNIPYTHGHVATYRRKGTGPRILLCHGWESNAWRWRKLLDYLGDTDYDIIMLDGPAHGASTSDTFTAVKYAEAIDTVCRVYQPHCLICHSIGAFASCYYLAHYPHSIQRLVLLGPPDTLTRMIDNYFDMLGMSQGLRKAFNELFADTFPHPPQFYEATKFVKDIHIPGVVIHDAEDYINLYSEGEAIAASWLEGELVTTKGYGHGLQDPEVFEVVKAQLALLKG